MDLPDPATPMTMTTRGGSMGFIVAAPHCQIKPELGIAAAGDKRLDHSMKALLLTAPSTFDYADVPDLIAGPGGSRRS